MQRHCSPVGLALLVMLLLCTCLPVNKLTREGQHHAMDTCAHMADKRQVSPSADAHDASIICSLACNANITVKMNI